jgi:hypothetical protein
MSWGKTEKENWFKEQTLKRSYKQDVRTKIDLLSQKFAVTSYGSLPLDPETYPVFLIRSKSFDEIKKTILITGGVHGYETSGVHGALAFMDREAEKLSDHFNFICAPCVSPWAYETINRWNPNAIDPNRSFYPNSPAEECKFLLEALGPLVGEIYAHFDLHETTDTDNTVFRPALAQRDGIPEETSEIPDGFYVVGDSKNPGIGFQKAIIDSVREVTHIAPADSDGNIIGAPMEQEGVVNYDVKKLFLCAGLSNAKFVTTTEVYPDSPKVTDQNCIDAQVAAVRGGLTYILENS